MKVFQNKTLFKKIIILFVLIVIISFCIPKGVNAGGEELGGTLLKPIVSLFLAIGDGGINLIHSFLLQQDDTLLIVDLTENNAGSILFTILIGVVVAVVTAVVIVFASEVVIAALTAIGISNIAAVGVGTILLISVGSGTIAGVVIQSKYFDGDVRLPLYRISPEEIFSNKIPVFDVDFFNPSDSLVEKKEYTQEYVVTVKKIDKELEKLKNEYGFTTLKDTYVGMIYHKNMFKDLKTEIEEVKEKYGASDDSIIEEVEGDTWYYQVIFKWQYTDEKGEHTYQLIQEDAGTSNLTWYFIEVNDNDKDNPVKEEIFTILDSETIEDTVTVTDEQDIVIESTAGKLRNVISKWYSVLRNIALVALLLVLVYIGIRIITSSTASDKSKYKQMILDWVVAICLLFIMQYIMSFSNMLVKNVTELMCSVEFSKYVGLISDPDGKIEAAISYSDNEKILKKYGIIEENSSAKDLITNIDGINHINWNTNLMGILRIQAQLSRSEDMENTSLRYVGYMILFVMLVLFTFYFVYTYLRRVLYMAFLTIMAPFVAMTYPIDKINDGKAQAFNMWLKEYIFNLLIQPLHLLLYTVLVGSAVEFAEKNILYSIVAIAFLIPAEKLTRKFFGFEKAQTPGLLGGAAGAAFAWSGINRLLGHKPPKPGSHNIKSDGKVEESDDKHSVNFANNFDKEDAILGFSSIGKNHEKENENSLVKVPKVGQPKEVDTTQNNKQKEEKIFKDSKNDSIPKNDFYSKYGNDKINRGRIKGVAKKYATQGRYYAKNMKNKIRNSIQNAHPGRTIAKLGAGALGAATFATAGGIVGLTSGDPSKVLQYTTAGAIGGYNVLKDVPENINSALSVDYTKEQNELIERSKYDSEEEYQEKQKEEYVKQLKQNADMLAKFERKLGRKEAKKLMESDFIDSYVNDGITDIDDMYAGYIMENGLDDSEKLERNYVKANIKYGKQIGSDTTHMKKDDKDKWAKTFSAQLSKNKFAIDNKLDTDKSASEIMDNIDRFNKIKNS